uniref:WD repeat-containing protein 38 n=2 Tax=Denticeps clupeoides TaxID=299321 RepID=A0AAY3ZTJ9_9TELE
MEGEVRAVTVETVRKQSWGVFELRRGTMRRHAAATLAATDVRFYARHQAEVNCCALSRDCRSVLTCSDDGRLYLWDAGSAELLAELSGHAGPVKTCAVSPCGHLCASGSLDATVRIWDAAAAPVTCLRVLTGHKKSVETVSFSPDSRWLVSGSWDQSAVVWEVQTGQAFRELRGHTGAIQSSAFAEDSQYVATGAWDYMVKVWNLLVEDEVVTLEGHSGNIASVCFSVVGMLASGSWDSSVRVWLPEKGVCLFVLTGPTRAWVRSLAFSRDGLVLASAAEGDLIRIWDMSDGKCINCLQGHKDTAYGCIFSPSGALLTSGSAEWD